jgi:hypothetical protein
MLLGNSSLMLFGNGTTIGSMLAMPKFNDPMLVAVSLIEGRGKWL